MLDTKIPLLAVCAALLAGCAVQPPAEPFAISNLKYGTMCGSPDWRVCTETSDIALDGTGRCIYDHKEIPCNWYGFSFDYTPKRDDIALACDMLMDHKTDMGNPMGIVSKDTSTFHYEVALNGGHFVNPQYDGHKQFDGVQSLTETCAYRGQKVFEFTLRFRYVDRPA